ncbi:hypothetical protein INS49_002529 [Diaporthe citri]|uniref:uncharacterized protein n=1 Tax=Diaporthe citri TaxID=83186 RepID=UPI001C8169B5|nr:uncharacterized protein INS49_002529 [Diaporthe citri]KAG6368324.1 hypothetical protein INS49_002529 [Diaporthe citri]
MAVVLRGWSRTASTALKLATAERIIGYQFNDVDRLYEALDQTKQSMSSPSGKQSRDKPRNARLALVGDAQAKLYLAQKWYDSRGMTGNEWSIIATETLSNQNFGEFGFKLGLDECAIPNQVEDPYDMATTVEAVFAAVQMDGASQEQFRKIMARFGLQHELVEPIQRAWIYEAVKSVLRLPNHFFIGHHLKLQQAIFDTQLRQSTARGEKILGGRVMRSWGSIKKLWRTMKWIWLPPRKVPRKPKKISVSLRGQKAPVLRPVPRSPDIVKPLVEGARPTGAETIITPSKDVATSETNILGEKSLDGFEDDERAAAPEQTTDREHPVKKHEAAKSSPPEVPTPSQPRKPQARPVPPSGDALADDKGTTTNDSQDSKKASRDEPATNSSRNDDAATGAELEVEHQPVEATEAGDSEETSKRVIALKKEAKQLKAVQMKMEQVFRQLRSDGIRRTRKQSEEFVKLLQHRARVKELLKEENLKRQPKTPS